MQRRRVVAGTLAAEQRGGGAGLVTRGRAGGKTRVVLTDVDVPFWRMVAIILKFMIASVPAAILFYLISIGIVVLCVMAFGGLAALAAGASG
jgi:hypothetical protein